MWENQCFLISLLESGCPLWKIPGITRDRLYAETDWNGRSFTLVDTGGIEPSTDDEILLFMRRQAEIAIETADVIIFVADIKTGVTAADMDVANILLKSKSRCSGCQQS